MAMLDSSHLQDSSVIDDQSLDPFYYYEILKKRKFYGLIPFIGVFAIGFAVTMLWPPTFQSEGKILVQSQQIPVDLVRPTVTATASERLATIEQRVMTRDNLLKIVDKYQLFANQRDTLSRTDILDLMRANTVIKAVDLDLQKQQNDKFAVAITVGFTDQRPEIATKVANELMTLFLNEDARNRTTRATETTKFLEQEAQKLQTELASFDAKLLAFRRQAPETTLSQSATLKTELAQKLAVFSESHPDVRRLKAQIEALDKVTVPAPTSAAAQSDTTREKFDPFEQQRLYSERMGVQNNLESTSQKLAAARRGENLERDQFAERLEVLEQAIPPQRPIKPNRPKFIAFAFFAAVIAGFAGIMAVESFDKTIRGSKDLLTVANGQLIVAIPYIVTQGEVLHRKRQIVFAIGISILAVLVGLAAAHFFVRPLDELWPVFIRRLGI